MWEQLKQLILSLFGRKPAQSDDELRKAAKYERSYKDITQLNLTAIVANKLATLAVNDSSVSVMHGDYQTARTELLDNIAQRTWDKMHASVSAALGCGAVALIPYCVGGKIYSDIVGQGRLFVTASQGDDITQMTILSDCIIRDSVRYMRFTDYSIDGRDYVIRNRATRDNGPCDLSSVTEWAAIQPEIRIQGVDRLPIGYIRCPADNRNPDSLQGVPITYGAESIIADIKNTLEQIRKEYEKKKVRIFADTTLFDKDKKIDEDLYVKFMRDAKLSDGGMIDIFDPAIRDSAYFARLTNSMELLEKAIGVNKGVLTDLQTQSATATQVRRSTYDTFALVGSIRREIMRGFNNFIYGCNVLANYFTLTPPGDYTVSYDWDYSLLEDSAETFSQLMQAKNAGAVSVVDIRQFVKPDETPEEAQAAIDEIKRNTPSLRQVIGVDE